MMLCYLLLVLCNLLILWCCWFDGVLLFGVFMMFVLFVIVWSVVFVFYLFNGVNLIVFGLFLLLFVLFLFSIFGNFGVFFEIVVVVWFDGCVMCLWFVLVNVVGFCVMIVVVVVVLWGFVFDVVFCCELKWDKIECFCW